MLLFVNKPEMYVLMGYGFQEMSSKLFNYQNRKCRCFTPERAPTGICDACMHCLHPPLIWPFLCVNLGQSDVGCMERDRERERERGERDFVVSSSYYKDSSPLR